MAFGPDERGWTPPTPGELNRLFPGCDVLSMVGRGGMGAVYLAMQAELDRAVAIKLLPVETASSPAAGERFTREARAMARLNHPNIAPIYDSGRTAEGHRYFVMEFVDGDNLHTLIHAGEVDGRRLSVRRVLEMAIAVCDALTCAHAQGIVHRDIKPANILVDREGKVKVVDFGVARVLDSSGASSKSTLTGTIVGTPDYIAPEQLRGEHADHRADIYSLGVTIYEMLCARVPRGIFAMPSRIAGSPLAIDRVISRALQQLPGDRYSSAAEMRADLAVALASLERAGGTGAGIRRFAMVAGFAAVAAGAAVFMASREPDAPDGSPARPAHAPASPAATAAAPTQAAKRALIEWVLANGDGESHVSILPGSQSLPVKIANVRDIPPGEWQIVEIWLDRLAVGADSPPLSEAEFTRHMSATRDLRFFFLRKATLPDSAYAFLARNPNLQSVSIEDGGVGDDVLGHLAPLKNIRRLNFNTSVRFTGRGMDRLACLPVLEDAIFYWTSCGDPVAEILAKCPSLAEAHLERTRLTDSGLMRLSRLPHLRKITTLGTQVTESGVEAFRRANPECEIAP